MLRDVNIRSAIPAERGSCIEIDGIDLASSTRAYTIKMEAGSIPVLELELSVNTGWVGDAEVRVFMRDDTRRALMQLGWTPPHGE